MLSICEAQVSLDCHLIKASMVHMFVPVTTAGIRVSMLAVVYLVPLKGGPNGRTEI